MLFEGFGRQDGDADSQLAGASSRCCLIAAFQLTAIDLAGGSSREGIDEVDQPWQLEVREVFAAVPDEFAWRRWCAKYDGCAGLFAIDRIVDAEAGCVEDVWVFEKHLLDLVRGDVLATAHDEVFQTSR